MTNKTYRSLNKQLTLCGCDKQIFIAAMFIGFGLFVSLGSIATGITVFVCFAFLGRLKAKDPAGLRLLFNPGSARNQYDPAKRVPFLYQIDETQ